MGRGGRREERGGRLQREEHEEEGTAAVWASSLLARLLKVIIEFLCRASPPCGTVLGCEVDDGASERAREREKLASPAALLTSNATNEG